MRMIVALCCTMLTENLGWVLVCAKFILRFLTAEQKEKRNGDIYTGGQNHRHDRKRSATEQIEWKDHARCFLRRSRFDILRVVRSNPTVNQEFLLTVVRRLRERVRKKRWDLETDHASATTHATRSIQQFNAIKSRRFHMHCTPLISLQIHLFPDLKIER